MTKWVRNKTVNELPLNEIMPKVLWLRALKKSMRSWRNDQAATLFYAEALDEGAENKVDYRDVVNAMESPFDKINIDLKTKQRWYYLGNETTVNI
jgi:hypothetical protein